MQRKRTHSNIVLAAATAASLAFGGQVSAQVIRITNAGNHEIPLKSGSSVQIDSAGNLLAECALTNSECTQLSGGPGEGTPPTATLSRTDSDTDVRLGESISLSWTSSVNADACKVSSSPQHGSFTGARDTASSVTLAPASVGTHTYTLVCYNEDGASLESQQVVTVGESDIVVPPTSCETPVGTLGHQPTGWGRVNMTWAQLFTPRDGNPVPVYPTSNGFPVPIGANKGQYVAASFTPLANQTVNMVWDRAQAKPTEGYSTARPAAGMFISISPCPGDLRPADATGGFLANGCRKFQNEGTLIYSTMSSLSQSTSSACKLEAGKTYYINVLPANPYDGLTTNEHSCDDVASSALGCDVQARSGAN